MTTMLVVLLQANFTHAQQAFFMGLGDLPGGAFSSTAWDISADGSVVVGSSRSTRGSEGFRWTRETGMVSFGAAGQYANGVRMRVSADGSTIVGTLGSTSYDLQPFRWSQEMGIEYLPLQEKYGVWPVAVSGDGSIVILNMAAFSPMTTPYSLTARWTLLNGYEVLFEGGSRDMTPDGSVILTDSVLWSTEHGATDLGSFSQPRAISADGKVAVGGGERWTKMTGAVNIDPLPDGAVTFDALGISADGSVVTGRALYVDSGFVAYIWDALHGSRNLKQLLSTDYGLAESLVGWNLLYAYRVSADGRTVTGWGINPAGDNESWIAFLGAPVPEPGTLLLAAMTIVPLAWRRRVQNHARTRRANLRFAALPIAIVVAIASADSAYAQPAFFMGLGDLPGGDFYSDAADVSGDGSVVVGTSLVGPNTTSEYSAFRWTRETGMIRLGSSNDPTTAVRISGDGKTIVGGLSGSAASTPFNAPAYRWREDTGMIPLPTAATGVVGVSRDGSSIAFIRHTWSEAGGLIGSPNGMRIADISEDGTALVGWEHVDGFIWTQQGSTVLGPPLGDGTRFFNPARFSADGNAVVGHGGPGLLWTRDGGLTLLGTLPDGATAAAVDVSADASVIVGGRIPYRNWGAWIWRETGTIELLRDVLTNEYGLGAQVANWRLGTASAMSNDGRTIVGSGTNPNGQSEGWVAFLGTPVPEPSALLLAGGALVPLTWRRRAVRIHDNK